MVNFSEPNFTDLPGKRALPRMYSRSAVAGQPIDVSVITPYHNTEAFFVDTFVALQAQSLQNWEWIIVDDGSTDQASVERLASVALQDSRIQVIRQANAGPGAARNTAYRQATGRFVCLLDSDDMFEPTYLEKCVWFLDSNPEFAFCNSFSVVFGDQCFLHAAGFERGKTHVLANSGPPISVIRHAAYSACGGFDESIRFGHEDWDFWLAMAKTGHWGYTIQEFLQWYRKRGNGRYEEIMRAGNVNAEFEAMMLRKYEGLEKTFPEPTRRHPEPYETINAATVVHNPLAANPTGRRIMFIIPWMVTGGADRVNLDLIEGLVANGHEVTVCATLPTDHVWEHQFSHWTPDIFILPNILATSDYPRFLAHLIESRQIDTVLVTGSTIGYQLLPYLRAVSPDVAFLDMSHVEEIHWLNGGHPRFGVGYQEALDLNIVTTRHLAEWMQDRGGDRTRIRVMYTGIRSAKPANWAGLRTQVRQELDIPADVPVIVFAGRICEQKRPAMLAEILKLANDKGLVFRALIIGSGEQKELLEDLLKQYSLSSCVQMLGAVSHERWLNILVASDIFLMPSQYEGISIALLEAMAAGVVPVVSKVGGQEEIVDPAAGVLVPHGSNELSEYLEAISKLLSDPAHLHAMSAQCKALATSKLSWEVMTHNFLAVVDEAHQLKLSHPRNPINPRFGLELAALSLENKRLADAVAWLWNTKPHVATDSTATQPTAAETQSIVKFAVLFSQTGFARKIVQSAFLRRCAKWLLRKMA
jgi:glycosyltransferase involved in cell wall biosynthesis